MKLTKLLSDSDDSRAVSPVIGVILMVAITVILAAVIGTFVLGLGDSVESAPQASFNFDYDDTNEKVTIRHRGGDNIDASKLEVRVNGASIADDGDVNYKDGGSTLSDQYSSFNAGNEVTIQDTNDYDSGDNVDVVYISGDKQDIIGSFTVP
jgi:flagellin-like protein